MSQSVNKTAYEQFREAALQIITAPRRPGRNSLRKMIIASVPADEERPPLNASQLDALSQLQQSLLAIGRMQATINQLIALHRLPVRPVSGIDTGFMWSELETAICQHNCALAHQRNVVK